MTAPVNFSSNTPENDAQKISAGPETEAGLAVIILAAGSSSRLGQSKQLLSVSREPLLVKTIKTALDAKAKKVLVVLGDREREHRAIIEHLPITIISNEHWQTGMGSSLKAGLNYLLQGNNMPEGILVLVCDQPLLTAEHLNNLINRRDNSENSIVASAYAHTTGVPVLFSKMYFNDIMNLGDQEGAKKIIQRFPKNVVSVDFPDGAIDIDTMDDYQNFIRRRG